MLSHRLRENERDPDEGFTLLEVLVVMVIIAVLVAIATPLYRAQRVSANNANLQQDLRNSASAYMGWRATGGTNRDFYQMSGGRRSIHVVGYDVQIAVAQPVVWNDIAETIMYPIAMTDNSSVEIVVNTVPGGAWGERPHQEGEFCVVGTNVASDYDYVAGSADGTENDPNRYSRLLFFDGLLGRVTTIEELVKLQDEGVQISCFGHATRHKEMMGL